MATTSPPASTGLPRWAEAKLTWPSCKRSGAENKAWAEAAALLPQAQLPAHALAIAQARLQLVQAEVAWLQGALDAASCGVKVVHILDGRQAHAMLQLLFTQEDCGTAIRKA